MCPSILRHTKSEIGDVISKIRGYYSPLFAYIPGMTGIDVEAGECMDTEVARAWRGV